MINCSNYVKGMSEYKLWLNRAKIGSILVLFTFEEFKVQVPLFTLRRRPLLVFLCEVFQEEYERWGAGVGLEWMNVTIFSVGGV